MRPGGVDYSSEACEHQYSLVSCGVEEGRSKAVMISWQSMNV